MEEIVVVHPITGVAYTREGRLGDAIIWRRDGAVIAASVAACEIARAFDALEEVGWMDDTPWLLTVEEE